MKNFIYLLILTFITSIAQAEKLPQPRENKISAQMAINSSNYLIQHWESKLNNEKLSEDELFKLKNNIKNEKLWLDDMQSILDDKKPSGEGFKLRRTMHKKALEKSTVNSPTYCNIKSVLKQYDKLEKGEPKGGYSCD